MAEFTGDEMEEKEEIKGGIGGQWYWGSASAAQLWLANSLRRKGLAAHSHSSLLGIRAFGAATLYVGAFGCAIITTIQLSGIRSMQDLRSVAASIKNSRKSTS